MSAAGARGASSGSATWRALGTGVSVYVTDPAHLASTRALVERQLEELDLAASRFRPDSELAQVNRAAGRWAGVSSLFLDCLRAALRAARLTEGSVDPTIGRALRLAGYDRDFDAIGAAPTITVAEVPGWRSIEVDWDRAAVRLKRGIELDLGATAKAFAADRAAQTAAAATGCGVLVNLGGDLAAAGPAPAAGWPVRVTEDHAAGADATGQTVSIVSGGLATSSTTVRRWSAGQDSVHHIVDPATGAPVDVVWRTVSVAADSCLDANTASTAAVVLGEQALDWIAQRRLPARLVAADGRVARVAGWPEDVAS